ncbi:uncharacterized protein Dwil_GK27423 [Drosophila willistoni]|uniref:MD-2-related lipid-recognition domain-containing protein n=1 Tax=Drosophila willistoni TaxID=7260 RepID=A0A0Q9X5P1_DROWI|nr:uncharacterized protein LOC26529425 [Drosophila willistoni]KRG00055.1 uncharacterized protein Dwil_GK27423 [Drosophila willistoni]
MWSHYRFVFWFTVFFAIFAKIDSKFEFTNIKCESLDKAFCGFESCYIKSVNRSYKYFTVKVNLYQLPTNWSLFKRFNGYKPFLYNLTVDGCKFLRNVNAANPVSKYFFEFISPYANVNHKCPFNHDIIVEKVPINAMDYRLTKVLPFPEGDYLFDTLWIAYGVPRGYVKLYGTLS